MLPYTSYAQEYISAINQWYSDDGITLHQNLANSLEDYLLNPKVTMGGDKHFFVHTPFIRNWLQWAFNLTDTNTVDDFIDHIKDVLAAMYGWRVLLPIDCIPLGHWDGIQYKFIEKDLTKFGWFLKTANQKHSITITQNVITYLSYMTFLTSYAIYFKYKPASELNMYKLGINFINPYNYPVVLNAPSEPPFYDPLNPHKKAFYDPIIPPIDIPNQVVQEQLYAAIDVCSNNASYIFILSSDKVLEVDLAKYFDATDISDMIIKEHSLPSYIIDPQCIISYSLDADSDIDAGIDVICSGRESYLGNRKILIQDGSNQKIYMFNSNFTEYTMNGLNYLKLSSGLLANSCTLIRHTNTYLTNDQKKYGTLYFFDHSRKEIICGSLNKANNTIEYGGSITNQIVTSDIHPEQVSNLIGDGTIKRGDTDFLILEGGNILYLCTTTRVLIFYLNNKNIKSILHADSMECGESRLPFYGFYDENHLLHEWYWNPPYSNSVDYMRDVSDPMPLHEDSPDYLKETVSNSPLTVPYGASDLYVERCVDVNGSNKYIAFPPLLLTQDTLTFLGKSSPNSRVSPFAPVTTMSGSPSDIFDMPTIQKTSDWNTSLSWRIYMPDDDNTLAEVQYTWTFQGYAPYALTTRMTQPLDLELWIPEQTGPIYGAIPLDTVYFPGYQMTHQVWQQSDDRQLYPKDGWNLFIPTRFTAPSHDGDIDDFRKILFSSTNPENLSIFAPTSSPFTQENLIDPNNFPPSPLPEGYFYLTLNQLINMLLVYRDNCVILPTTYNIEIIDPPGGGYSTLKYVGFYLPIQEAEHTVSLGDYAGDAVDICWGWPTRWVSTN